VQQEILKREEDAMRGIGQYRQSAQFGETVNKLLAPHLPLLKQHNVDPVQNMGQLLQLQHSLATGTEGDRLEVLRTIAQAYNINLAHLDPSSAPYIDPAVEGLQREIQALKSQLQTVQGAKVEEARTALRSEIDAFATNSANVYFNEVGGTMAQLLQSGQAQSLQEAYETAIWMVPAVRAKETQRLAAEAQKSSEAAAAETAAAAAAKTAAARKAAGVNVKVGATSAKGDGTSSTKRATIDETLAATLAEINARG
jgi:alanyl-tRNA synthetase